MLNYSVDGYSSDGYFYDFSITIEPSYRTDAVSIINDASVLLNDVAFSRWSQSELLSWLNAGQLEVATQVVNSNANTQQIQLVAGSLQSSPEDSIRIVEFVRNMGVDGKTPGAAIRQIDRKTMDRFYPSWTSDVPSGSVVHVMYDAVDNNSAFYVWPPQPNYPQYIEIIYAQIPQQITNCAIGEKITIMPYYRNALLDYVLYRAFAKDSDSANQAQRSQAHYQMFMQAIGGKFSGDTNANNDKAMQ